MTYVCTEITHVLWHYYLAMILKKSPRKFSFPPPHTHTQNFPQTFLFSLLDLKCLQACLCFDQTYVQFLIFSKNLNLVIIDKHIH